MGVGSGADPRRACAAPAGRLPSTSRRDRACFDAIVARLVTGCSWDTAAVLSHKRVSATTLRRRYEAWNTAGVFDWIAQEAIESYDRIVGLDYSAAAVDGSVHKAPCGGARDRQKPS